MEDSIEDDPGGGDGGLPLMKNLASALPATSDWAGGRGGAEEHVKLRSYEEIIADAKTNRNILEIQLKKNIINNEKPANLTFDQIGELLFDRLKIQVEDCLRLNLTSYRYDTKDVVLKPNIDLTPYIVEIEDFYGHKVITKPQSSKITRVSFRNVPSNVPDEEIIHLCTFYGKPHNNKVEYEHLSNSKWGVFQGSTRFVDMELHPGSQFSNFYWIEGPLPGDRGSRITVLHSGQERQCSHCFKTMSLGCPGQGQGKVCKTLGTKMTCMTDYMLELNRKMGYESLKTKHFKAYPVLDKTVVSNIPDLQCSEEDNGDETIDEVGDARSEVKILKEKLDLAEKELEESKNTYQRLHHAKRSSDLARNKIATATECLNMYLIENLCSKEVDEFDPSLKFLVSQYSSLLFTPECYTVNPDTNDVMLCENLFSDLLRDNPCLKDKIDNFKQHLKDKLTLDLSIRKERRLSLGSVRSRLPSMSSKRSNSESAGNATKVAKGSTLNKKL